MSGAGPWPSSMQPAAFSSPPCIVYTGGPRTLVSAWLPVHPGVGIRINFFHIYLPFFSFHIFPSSVLSPRLVTRSHTE